jgi:hypothetical protein
MSQQRFRTKGRVTKNSSKQHGYDVRQAEHHLLVKHAELQQAQRDLQEGFDALEVRFLAWVCTDHCGHRQQRCWCGG